MLEPAEKHLLRQITTAEYHHAVEQIKALEYADDYTEEDKTVIQAYLNRRMDDMLKITSKL